MLLLLLLVFSPGAEAKRLLEPPPALEASRALSLPELRHLAGRVGQALRDCVPLDAKVSVAVEDKTAAHYDLGTVAEAMRATLGREAGADVEVKAVLEFRENPRSFTNTLTAKAFRGDKPLCKRLHRTVVKKAR